MTHGPGMADWMAQSGESLMLSCLNSSLFRQKILTQPQVSVVQSWMVPGNNLHIKLYIHTLTTNIKNAVVTLLFLHAKPSTHPPRSKSVRMQMRIRRPCNASTMAASITATISSKSQWKFWHEATISSSWCWYRYVWVSCHAATDGHSFTTVLSMPRLLYKLAHNAMESQHHSKCKEGLMDKGVIIS